MRNVASSRRARLPRFKAVWLGAVLTILHFLGGGLSPAHSQDVAQAVSEPQGERSPAGRDPLLERLARKDPQAADALEAVLRQIADPNSNHGKPPGETRLGPSAAQPGDGMPPGLANNPLILKAWEANPASTIEALSSAGIRFPQKTPPPRN